MKHFDFKIEGEFGRFLKTFQDFQAGLSATPPRLRPHFLLKTQKMGFPDVFEKTSGMAPIPNAR